MACNAWRQPRTHQLNSQHGIKMTSRMAPSSKITIFTQPIFQNEEQFTFKRNIQWEWTRQANKKRHSAKDHIKTQAVRNWTYKQEFQFDCSMPSKWVKGTNIYNEKYWQMNRVLEQFPFRILADCKFTEM